MAQSTASPTSNPQFDQPVVLRQSPALSRAVIWVILGVTVSSVTWAAIAKIEQVVTATGQLTPQGAVKEIQAPVNGVVKDVYVEDGDQVVKGQPLLSFDSDAAKANKFSLLEVQTSLTQENQLYGAIINDDVDINNLQQQIMAMNLPPEMTALARNRLALVGEAQVIRAQLGIKSNDLTTSQIARLSASQTEYNSRTMAAQLELEQLQQSLKQTQVQLADSRAQLDTDRAILQEIQQRNTLAISQAEENLAIETQILERVQPLVADGAIAELQLERQRQQVNDRTANLIDQRSTGGIELEQQQQQVDSRLAEIDQLLSEQRRLQLDINQAKQELVNTTSLVERNLREQLDSVQQRLAEIDSQLNKVIVENNKRLAEVSSQLKQTEETLRYQDITAPISGTIFNLQADPGFVPRSGQADPLLEIVPDDMLVAEVFVTNRDIGFVLERFQEGKKQGKEVMADIRIDSFPFSSFGDIEGEVISIGSDALPPDETYNYFRFPVRVSLSEQSLRNLPLQSGMSVSVNIKIREKRSVLSLMTDLFSRRADDLKRLR